MSTGLTRFFERPVVEVARDLVGCELAVDGVGGVIVETEAYAPDDPACHGYRGRTARNATMFGPAARAYVYLSYGIHHCLNLVAEPEGRAAAVLIRALEPSAGLEAMRERRGREPVADLCSGPGKVCQSLGVDLALDGAILGAPPFRLTLDAAQREGPLEVVSTPRIGISQAVEVPWRFLAAGSPFVSGPRSVSSRG